MKVAFFLTPKAEVAWVKSTSTVRQAIERMENHRYTAVPILTPEGTYAGTLTEGDLLWFMKEHPDLRFEDTSHVSLSQVKLRVPVKPISIDADVDALLALALDQNFVPVVDDRQVFIGIVRRRSILSFFQQRIETTLKN